jgi:hypothetical protein
MVISPFYLYIQRKATPQKIALEENTFLSPFQYAHLHWTYTIFNLRLNILAEILQFGDREFYKDWWNAKTIDEV